MSTITTKDGAEIYLQGLGQWPGRNVLAWLAAAAPTPGTARCCSSRRTAIRVVAHDRRGHGRSSQASIDGNDMNDYADDLAALIEALDLKDATLVGHSTGGGEVTRYIGRHGTKRVAKAVLSARCRRSC